MKLQRTREGIVEDDRVVTVQAECGPVAVCGGTKMSNGQIRISHAWSVNALINGSQLVLSNSRTFS